MTRLRCETEVERLEGEMQRPGFWDDQEAAARTSAAHARAQRKLKTFEELESEAGDLGELAEMAAEDGGDGRRAGDADGLG